LSGVLRLFAIILAVLTGIALSLAVAFAPPTLYGLRPHAVTAGLDTHTTGGLIALAENGPVTGILTYDAWYKRTQAGSGWFLMPAPQMPDAPEGGVAFAVNGLLDPALSKLFGSAPRRCNRTPMPEKMIRAIEPDRKGGGFLGRSTCTRHRMDLDDVIAASLPATRLSADLTHAELAAFDARKDPLVQRDAVALWPTPYAFERVFTLPLVWQHSQGRDEDGIEDVTRALRSFANSAEIEGEITLRIETQDWWPNAPEAQIAPDQLVIHTDSGGRMIEGVEFREITLIAQCAPGARGLCDTLDLSALLAKSLKLRPAPLLRRALDAAGPVPDALQGMRGVLRTAMLERAQLHAPTSAARRFSVTWVEASAP
jgi:hypothetical protein